MRKRVKLSVIEYQFIFDKFFKCKWSRGRIARHLGRDSTTIGRALRRDYHPSPHLSVYQKALHAYNRSRERMSKSRKRLRLKTQRIRGIVIFLLCRWHWSPEQISIFLKKYELIISAKAIYNFIKKERRDLIMHLRRKGRPRRQRIVSRRSMFRCGVPAKKSIHQRPVLFEQGHWEIDSVVSNRGSKGGVLTIRELRTRRCYFFPLSDLRAETVMSILFPFFQSFPQHLRRTLTSDNGGEFAELYKLEKILPGFSVYYCDPYKAYQRGSVENANGELRRYFPKGTDFSTVTASELKNIEIKLNRKPMKCLNGRAPILVFNELLQKAA